MLMLHDEDLKGLLIQRTQLHLGLLGICIWKPLSDRDYLHFYLYQLSRTIERERDKKSVVFLCFTRRDRERDRRQVLTSSSEIRGWIHRVFARSTIPLTPKIVNDIHKRGDTNLGTSRGSHDTSKIADNIQNRGINQDFNGYICFPILLI
ncbi:uncharacterized protein LOC133739325 isoform X2 [Rosa rugosa]|uniref:uncharacterized protein LOC133739325 isoform X2 n=1 Tax=Rosa rugosa TaxID=74645 RepID=UPI002B410E2E|nr:uncharacterized protein LOC133739325 isoform X2 [Rosa rugosa]